ncbi:MAG: hypothetical protein HQ465_05390 [Rhodospirillales bacterium]|nr:hypothetical protein [Rhodospirillales bacterium]
MTVWLRRQKLYALSAFWSFEQAQGEFLTVATREFVVAQAGARSTLHTLLGLSKF